jgi:hypothetical protein
MMPRWRFSFIVFAVFLSAAVALAQDYKVETVQGLPGGNVAQAVKSDLDPSGLKFTNSQGKEVAEVWLRKSIPTAANPNSSSDVLYGGITPGTLVGVLDLPAAWSDFRGQSIKPGVYTLRYELIPQDGNHMGVSTYRDFVHLIPAAKDTDPSKVLPFKDVMQLSRLATGTGHPAVLVLDPAGQSVTTYPAAFQDDMQNWALQTKTTVGGKPLPMAFVLIGKYQG